MTKTKLFLCYKTITTAKHYVHGNGINDCIRYLHKSFITDLIALLLSFLNDTLIILKSLTETYMLPIEILSCGKEEEKKN